MAINLRRFKELGLPRLQLLSPVLLVAALGCSVWAATAVNAAMAAWANRTNAKALDQQVKIVKDGASAGQIMSSAQRLVELAPAMSISVSGATMVIAAKDPQQFTDWLNAVTAVQSTLAGYHWEAETICVVECPGGVSASATVRAFKPRFEVQQTKD